MNNGFMSRMPGWKVLRDPFGDPVYVYEDTFAKVVVSVMRGRDDLDTYWSWQAGSKSLSHPSATGTKKTPEAAAYAGLQAIGVPVPPYEPPSLEMPPIVDNSPEKVEVTTTTLLNAFPHRSMAEAYVMGAEKFNKAAVFQIKREDDSLIGHRFSVYMVEGGKP
jgi:hypothetical protein